ncbi:permease of the major facilitator superfamily [Apiospora kogelbergensis]|uniref:Permease of the major facilitator superfamily n=1 Tax=Apiospora kogelbergensis TaxID=1337665 RepID=A0AAW0QJK9_9PEZI
MTAVLNGGPKANGNGNNRPELHNELAASEQTPLLATASIAPAQDPDVAEAIVDDALATGRQNGNDKPLPRTQIFLLCYARLVEPVAFFSIFPYINDMILHVSPDIREADVGFYSGLIESLFSLTQMLVMLVWGRAADRVGRKPVLVASLVGVTCATSIFGLATSLWQMMLFRCLAGVFAGTIVTIRTMISEHSTPRTQARSFSFFAFAGNAGITVGPLLGGVLANPAKLYPRVFAGVPFFDQYPYALPSFAVGVVGLTAVLSSAFFVEETLVRKPKAAAAASQEEGAARNGAVKEYGTRELLGAPGVSIVLYVYAHVMLLAFAYTAIIPVFWFTKVKLGGFEFSEFQIGMFMALTGVSQAFWLLVVFPPLQHRLGTNGVMRLCANFYPFFLGSNILLNALRRAGLHGVFWVAAPTILAVGPGVSMSFTAVQLALNDVSPSPAMLGTLNALALTGLSGLRAFTPALFTSIFAVGANSQFLGGYFVWVLLVLLAAGFTVAARYLPEASEKDFPASPPAEAEADHGEGETR